MRPVQRVGVIILVVGVIALLGSCLLGTIGSSTPVATPKPVSHPTVVYEITGSATSVDVTLNNATGGTEQYSNVPTPYRYTYSNFTDNFLYISAQNCGGAGWVRVTIYVNGKAFKTSTSSGAYVIATANGYLSH